jgi:hypothetical protein
MSQEDEGALKNASVIIERFGGIRPMAAKVGAPVTTVQGWKKRDVIPGTRRDDVLKAANENNIDLSDLLKDSPPMAASTFASVEKGVKASESAFIDQKPPASNDDVKITVEPILRPQPKPLPASLSPRIDTTHEELMAAIEQGHKKAVRAALWTAAAFVIVLGAAGAYAVWPTAKKIERHESQIATLESKMGAIDEDVQAMNENAAEIKGLVPSEMRDRMAALKAEADKIASDVKTVAATAADIQKGVLAADAGSLSDRLSVLEAKLNNVEGGQAMKDLTARIRNLEVTLAGQEQLGASVAELTKIVDSIDGQVNLLDDKIALAQQTPGSALGETLQGVDNNDMKAAALLIAFSQLRDSLNRNEPFTNDLALLQKLVGEDDPELQAALTKLAPQAEKGGVLTSEGLSEEFKGLAGDIVFSSLKGEEVSVTDKAKVRLTQVLNVKKDGELLGGTPTQKTVAKAQEQLDNGDVQGAIATLNTLNGDAKTQAQPFIEQAQATLLADQVQNMLRQMIVANVGTNFATAAGAGAGAGAASVNTVKNVTDQIQAAMPGSSVVKDEDSGFAILPAPKGFKGFSSGPTE